MTGNRVLVVGDVMVDIIVTPDGPIVRGSDRRAEIAKRHGGSGANQAVWLGYFDVPVTFIARVGAADLHYYQRYFESFGVAPALSGDIERQTGMLLTLVDPDGERSFLTDRAANLNLGPRDVPAETLKDISLLVVSGYSLFEQAPRSAILGLVDEARELGIEFAVDPASTSFLAEMGPARFFEATRGAAMLFPNEEEAGLLTGTADVDEQLEVLLGHAELVAIKRGPEGAIAGRRGGEVVRLPAPKINVRDSTGAGDAFLARFVAERFSGAPLRQCLAKAIGAGSAAAAMIGGQPPR
ncbi:MAG: PfkB family carbohydrate kinase [Cucumibacter sp.]